MISMYLGRETYECVDSAVQKMRYLYTYLFVHISGVRPRDTADYVCVCANARVCKASRCNARNSSRDLELSFGALRLRWTEMGWALMKLFLGTLRAHDDRGSFYFFLTFNKTVSFTTINLCIKARDM